MIAVPSPILGASLLAWGWQTGQWPVAIVLALTLEAARRVRLRFDLGVEEHSRIADLCTVAFVGVAVLLAVNRGVAHGVLAAFQWLPVALAPILLAQFVSASGRVPLSALFRYLRKLKRKFPETPDPPVDTSPVYVAVVLIAAGMADAQGNAYFPIVVAIAGSALWMARPGHAKTSLWVLMFSLAVGGGALGHAGLARMQAIVENWVSEWYLRGLSGDAYRATTDIGSIGRLKLHDEIALRVYAPPGEANRPGLLHRASYNTYVGTTWLARGAPLQDVTADAGGLSWTLAPVAPERNLRIAARIERGRILLSLPSGTVRVTGLAATSVKRNALGAVHAELAGDWIQYEAEQADGADTAAAAGEAELLLPAPERGTFVALADELGLRGLAFDEALRRIREHFFGFSYSTWREDVARQDLTPLGEFVRESRSGHCEYFAAATTLLLRAAGIPARYATGYAALEYSALEGAWIVRARHAHAWARAWDGARWIDLDTTPPVWLAEEERLAPAWQKLADLARWAAFRWSQRGALQASDAWYGVLALLVAVLAWRLLRGRRVVAGPAATRLAQRAWPGADSDFYRVASALAKRGLGPASGNPPRAWLRGIADALPAEEANRLAEALRLHQRYRFDPLGLDAAARARLRRLCDELCLALARAAPA